MTEEVIIIAMLAVLIALVIVDIFKARGKNDKDDIILNINQMKKSLDERLTQTGEHTAEIINLTNNMINGVTTMMETRLMNMQESNEKNLEKIRGTVDEKLSASLDEKLSLSFKAVSERLEQVHRGLGEMQGLAKNVGDLTKIMSNVKTRGILGEITLGGILEEMLSKNQYEENIATIPGSREVVEYAVKLPGKGDFPVYIPIDAKFPLEPYKRLCAAYDDGNRDSIAAASKELERIIKSEAKDISTKYVSPPHTTDFAVMFLPVEGLYAEVVRNTELFEHVMNKYNILISGPSTLAALLCSLQMGFKTLAVSGKTSKIREVLVQVKKEFESFAGVLESVQKRLSAAENDMDKLIGVRTRQIVAKLDKMQEDEDE